jgi:hypothetical protein
MHFHSGKNLRVFPMNRRKNALYRHHIGSGGGASLYEGHDMLKTKSCLNPKEVDQPRINPGGSLTQNGLFEKAALNCEVAVYEKIHRGISASNGVFRLTDCTFETEGTRKVFQFRLELTDSVIGISEQLRTTSSPTRITPTIVKQEVRRRDNRKSVLCGTNDNLHFDHDVPCSKGGSSVTEKNIRLVCAQHNLSKHEQIE